MSLIERLLRERLAVEEEEEPQIATCTPSMLHACLHVAVRRGIAFHMMGIECTNPYGHFERRTAAMPEG